MKSAQETILSSVNECLEACQFMKTTESIAFMAQVAAHLANSFLSGNKVLIAGNGGSLCDAMHFAEELTGYFRHKRPALPAISLSDSGHMSCVGNDVGFDQVFARGVEALGKKGDIFVALTTSGNSQNLIEAVAKAKEQGLYTIGFLGKKGGALKDLCDLCWIVPGFSYSDRIQEVHMAAIHIVIELLEQKLFQKENSESFLTDSKPRDPEYSGA
ncbi:MAG: Phosphoheptose isomerase [Chlamydiia bacterium]|nr:Phosphoheptose isomerase [Chlamydiia bacterium]